MATSGSFNTDSIGAFFCSVEWWRTGSSSERNEHYIHAKIKTHNTPGSYRTVYDRNLYLNSNLIWSDSGSIPMYDDEILGEVDFTVSSYNTAGDGRFSLSFDAGIGITSGSNISGSGTWDLDRIPRYTTITSFNVQNITGQDGLTKVKYVWTASDNCDWAQYSKDNGSHWSDLPVNGVVSGLTPNTSYNFKLKVRRTDSQLWTETQNAVNKSTYDIAKISNCPNFIHGDNEVISITNPASIASLSLAMMIGDSQILTRTVTTGSNTIQFTDSELDSIYKKYGSSNSLVATFILSGGGYTNSQTCTITLTGNQKTANIKKSNIWKRAKVFINKDGTYKKAVIWVNINGTWKRAV